MVTVNSHRRKRHTSLRPTHKTTKLHWFCANVHLYWFLEHLFSKRHRKPHLWKMHFRKIKSLPSTHNAKGMTFRSKLIRTTQKCTKNNEIALFWSPFSIYGVLLIFGLHIISCGLWWRCCATPEGSNGRFGYFCRENTFSNSFYFRFGRFCHSKRRAEFIWWECSPNYAILPVCELDSIGHKNDQIAKYIFCTSQF